MNYGALCIPIGEIQFTQISYLPKKIIAGISNALSSVRVRRFGRILSPGQKVLNKPTFNGSHARVFKEMKMKQRDLRTAAALMGAAVAAAGFCNSARATVVVQEFYGDGGFAAGNTFTNDYVDLYNAGTAPVNIAGYVLETGSYSNALYTTEPVTLVDSTPLAAGAYFLIEGHAAGTFAGAATFPTANQYATQAASALGLYPSYSAGKIALFDATGVLQDYVGYGDSVANGTAPAYEGTGEAAGVAYPVFTGTNALTRTVFTDATATGPDTSTENNLSDFVSDTPSPQVTAAVPEPTTLGLIAAGGAMLIARRRKV